MKVSEVVIDSKNRITAICNLKEEWCLSAEKAIQLVESTDFEIFVSSGINHIQLTVVEEEGRKYLSTTGLRNRLRELPICTIEQAIPYLTDPRTEPTIRD